MRLSIIALASLIIGTTAVSDTMLNPQPNWQPVIGVSPKVGKIFHNKNAIVHTSTEGGTYTYGELMFIPAHPRDISNIAGKKLIAKSMAIDVLIDCDTGLSTTLTNYYFANRTDPKIKETPMLIVAHEFKAEEVVQQPKTSHIYRALCPSYI